MKTLIGKICQFFLDSKWMFRILRGNLWFLFNQLKKVKFSNLLKKLENLLCKNQDLSKRFKRCFYCEKWNVKWKFLKKGVKPKNVRISQVGQLISFSPSNFWKFSEFSVFFSLWRLKVRRMLGVPTSIPRSAKISAGGTGVENGKNWLESENFEKFSTENGEKSTYPEIFQNFALKIAKIANIL